MVDNKNLERAGYILWQITKAEDDPEARREKALLLAIIERAILDYYSQGKWVVGVSSTDLQVHERAREWILSTDIHEWSFTWVCDHLGCEADNIRKYILSPKNSKFKTTINMDSDGIYRRMTDNLSTATGQDIYI